MKLEILDIHTRNQLILRDFGIFVHIVTTEIFTPGEKRCQKKCYSVTQKGNAAIGQDICQYCHHYGATGNEFI